MLAIDHFTLPEDDVLVFGEEKKISGGSVFFCDKSISAAGDAFLPDVILLHTVLLLVQAQYQTHVAEMEALRAGMPPVFVNHNNSGGPAVRDIHMENFSVTVGGRDLIQDCTVTLAFGRHYGELQHRFLLELLFTS